MNKNQKIKKELKFYGRKVTTAFVMAIVFVTVAGTSIWALAAFTEPTDTPSNSVQDWAKNIMGANNSDNAFDSGDVVANSDGSIVERLEDIKDDQNQNGVSAIASASTGKTWDQAVSYCEDLSAQPMRTLDNSKSNISISYDDWKLATREEIKLFYFSIGTSFPNSTSPHWTIGEASSTDGFYCVPNNDNPGAALIKTYTTSSIYAACVR